MNDTRQIQQQIDELNLRIDAKLTSEDRAIDAVRFREEARRMLAEGQTEQESLDELENFIFTREQLRLQLEAAQLHAQQNAGDVQIVGTAAQEMEAPREIERPNVFVRFGRWVKSIFSRKTPDPSEIPVRSKKERDAAIKQMRKEEAEFESEKIKQHKEAAAIREKLAKKGTTLEDIRMGTPIFEDVGYTELMNAFRAANWDSTAKPRSDYSSEEEYIKANFQYFLGQLTNRNILSVPVGEDETRDATDGDVLHMLVDAFSREQILRLIGHCDHDTIVEFMRPLLEFDMQDFLKRFPVHKKQSEESRLKMLPGYALECRRFIGYLQWGQCYALQHFTKEERDKFERAQAHLARIRGVANRIGFDFRAPNFSYTEELGMRLKEYDDSEKCIEHKDELLAIYTDVCGEKVDRDWQGAQALRDRGYGAFSNIMPVPSAEMNEKVQNFDRQTLEDAIIEIERFSLVTESGRPRLLGLETCEQLLRYGRIDLDYYFNILRSASVVQAMFRDGNPFAHISTERRNALLSQVDRIRLIYSALEDRLSVSGKTAIDARDTLSEGGAHTASFALAMQSRDIEDFESGAWHEKRTEKAIKQRRERGRRQVELETKLYHLGGYDEAADEQARLEDYAASRDELKLLGSSAIYQNTITRPSINDKEDAQAKVREVIAFSLLDKDGRPRLLGYEPAKELIEFGVEDLRYYEQLVYTGKQVLVWIDQNQRRYPHFISTRDWELFCAALAKAERMSEALGSRLENADEETITKTIERLGKNRDEKKWYLRMQKEELDAYEGPEYTPLSKTGEMIVPSMAERELAILEQEKKDRIYDEERAQRTVEVREMINNNTGYATRADHSERVAYAEFRQAYIEGGWMTKETGKHLATLKTQEEKDAYLEANINRGLKDFMRELDNPGCFDEKNLDENGQVTLDTHHFSKESYLFLLRHRTPDAIERLITPILAFDIEKIIEEYPFHKVKTEAERVALARKANEKYHHYQGIAQWVEKFGETVMTPEQLKRFNRGAYQFSKFAQLFTACGVLGDFSFKECIETELGDHRTVKQGEEWSANVDDMRALLEQHKEQFADALAQREKHEAASKVSEVNRTGILAGELRTLSLVDGNRPRLLGNEDFECLMRYGLDDLMYYARMAEVGKRIDRLLTAHAAELGMSEQDVKELKVLSRRAKNLYSALSYRFSSIAPPRTEIRNMLNIDQEDRLWYLRMQSNQLG